MTTSKHTSSKLVEQMKKVHEEAKQEIEQVVKIFQEFQSKIELTEISD